MSYVLPGPAFSYGVAVTPTDTNSTANIRDARFLQNIGTAGTFVVAQNVSASPVSGVAGFAPAAATTVTVYLGQGQTIEVGASWYNVRSTSLTAGVSLVAYHGN